MHKLIFSITVLLEVLCERDVSLVNDHEVLLVLVLGLFIRTLEILVGVLIEDIVKHVNIPLQCHIGKREHHGHLQSICGPPHFVENEGPNYFRDKKPYKARLNVQCSLIKPSIES
jgi:hypothetical protein